MRSRACAGLLVVLACGTRPARAQGSALPQSAPASQADTAPRPVAAVRCDSILHAPTPDSLLVDVDMHIAPYEDKQLLPDWYRQMIGDGVLQFLVLPRRLVLDTYATEDLGASTIAWASRKPLDPADLFSSQIPEMAVPMLRGAYAVLLQRDGHLRNPRVIGGVRNVDFDSAVVAALTAIDTAHALPALPDSAPVPPDGIELRILIGPRARGTTRDGAAPLPDTTGGVQPLMRLRLPRYRILLHPVPDRGDRYATYPPSMRDRNIDGDVLMEFVIDPDGHVDQRSFLALEATAFAFVGSAVGYLSEVPITPLVLDGGCPVRSWALMPFSWRINR